MGFFNVLGPQKAPFLTLAPCCLPRLCNRITIRTFETDAQRQRRLRAQERRELATRAREMLCLCCGASDHRVRFCPALPDDEVCRQPKVKI